MLKTQKVRRILTMLCCISILAVLCLPISAAEGELGVTYVPITGDGFVADIMNGVEARYNLHGPTLYCVELITRYYEEVYGLALRVSGGAPVVLNSDNFYFEKTTTPKQGDVMYGAAAARSKSYNHWSLVKSVDGESVTCFEQNWRWNDQAGVDRKLQFPNEYYEFYTLKSKDGTRPQVLNGSLPTASGWAESYVDRAAEAGIAPLGTNYQAPATRAEFCQMAVNVAVNYGAAADPAKSACENAASLGLITVVDAGTQTISREEAAVITTHLIDRIGQTPPAVGAALQAYKDAGFISAWASEAVAKLTVCGLMSGTGGQFRPQDKLTNEQAATLLVRVSENPNPTPIAPTDRPTAQRARIGRSACAAADLVALSAGNMMLSRLPLAQ